MSPTNRVSDWVPRFLRDHVLLERNLSRNTLRGYRDSLQLLLVYLGKVCRKPVDSLTLDDISPERVKQFLQHLEQERKCSIATRNQRLAALHAWARFVGSRNVEYLEWCNQIRNIPFKKTIQEPRTYLDKSEMDALLNAPDRRTAQGRRDYAVMLFLYNTGSRVDEVAQLLIEDLHCRDPQPWVRILGKGNKVRICPLWALTVDTLRPLIEGRAATERVFLNRRHQPITRFGIFALVKRHATEAAKATPTLQGKRVSPHTIRHTTACHLLKSGVDINTVRAWLGHVSVDTTNIYAQIDLEMKIDALTHCEIFDTTPQKRWKEKPSVLEFLKSL